MFLWAMVVAQVIAHQTTDLEALGFYSCWELGFFLSSLYLLFSFSSVNQWCVLNQVPTTTLLILQNFQRKKGGLALQLEAKQA